MINIYNTLSQKKEEFRPLKEGHISFYLCGPTVYDVAHLGHGRNAVAFDVIRRYFIYKGYKVKFVTNYTDVDDKMIKNAAEKNLSVKELSEKIIPLYERDYKALKVMPGDVQPRATGYIKEIIKLIEKLEKAGATYELNDGIYFDINKFPEYGKLSKQKLEDLQMGARVEVNKDKRNPQDFALWKKEKPGEPSWESPWGKGRPGWHIECSAMSNSLLGETFDIHAGGADLIFPHHECEIAQSETANKKTFAKYWMHNGFINLNEEKMSKSIGNIVNIQNLLEKYTGSVIRYLYLQTHYRSPINFSDDLLEQSKNSLERIHDFMRFIKQKKEKGKLNKNIVQLINISKEKFEKSMDDDFETPEALASLFELLKDINIHKQKNELTTGDQKAIIDYLNNINEVFAVIIPEEETLTDDIEKLIKSREDARKSKDWAKADEIRDKLAKKGIVLEDTEEGTIWKKFN